jgi:hypothetical protein
MNAPQAQRLPVALALVAMLAACGKDAAEPPDNSIVQLEAGASITQGNLSIQAEAANTLGIAVSDVLERVVPALDNSEQLSAVIDALGNVREALLTRSPVHLSVATEAFRRSFDNYALDRLDGAIHPDIAVVRLLLEDVSKFALNPPLDTLKVK